MASKAPSKSAPKKPKPKAKTAPAKAPTAKSNLSKTAGKTAGRATDSSPSEVARAQARPAAAPVRRGPVPRSLVHIDDDDVLMAHGGGGGGFGRCGGRLLSNRTEQFLCHRLGIAGVVHSHTPRHYEVRYPEGQVAAYAPQIVLRGRGREGKSVVIEAVEEADSPILRKVMAFRSQYGQEFYVILVATDDVLEEIPLAAFDESCPSTNVNALIARLAE